MSRRSSSRGARCSAPLPSFSASFPDTLDAVEVLDHLDAIDVLVKAHLLSAHTYRLLHRARPCLAILLLDSCLSCLATVIVDNIPHQPDDDSVVKALAGTLGQVPPSVHGVVLVMCWPEDPDERRRTVAMLSELGAPLEAFGIELRDIIECFPSGFTSLRADLTEWVADPPSSQAS